MKGVLIAAPSSGSGKTVITLALLRALKRAGHIVGSVKIGPDYIDPGFHSLASNGACLNIDGWAMRSATRARQLARIAESTDLVIAEGVMGLFDGAADGSGSSADLAAELCLPIILIVDVSGQSASAAAIVAGFNAFRNDIKIAGVIFNRVGSARHEQMLRQAMASVAIPIVGCLPRDETLALDSRHLGLVQAGELGDLEKQIDAAATLVNEAIDLDGLIPLSAPVQITAATVTPPLPPIGQNIAVASDTAFSFCYPHILKGWQKAGVSISTFSPLTDEAPPVDCDAIYLPGGYPELHAAKIASNEKFMSGLRQAAERNAIIYGECGGFMVLGQSLTDRDGISHAMAGLLPIETSFASPKLHLGYRKLAVLVDGPLGKKGMEYRGHEFHYSTQTSGADDFLFEARDALDEELGTLGCRRDNVMGSYIHLIDRVD
jgi:cobyrinic acid a,c-diamide synthase